MDAKTLVERNGKYTLVDGSTGFSIGFGGMRFEEADLEALHGKLNAAHVEMGKIEAGEIKNPDENRKVTHFTDRAAYQGEQLFQDVEQFVEAVRSGAVVGSTGKKIESVIINGIGGSALGPQLVQFALNGPYWNELPRKGRSGYPKIYFVDNTDSAGVVDVLGAVSLEKTLVVSISKSGGTQETKNNQIAFAKAYDNNGLKFVQHACAITMVGSELDRQAKSEGWLKIFPMAESIGGRTSVTSVVGHLPAALAGINFKALLEGACAMDVWTREADFRKNPASMLAAMWHIAGNGKGDRNMVIVPYSDRFVLLSKYMQQLVMESIGKEKDLDGKVVHQGLNVFGNKGGTDAHAYIQQLNDGRDDFFVTFIEVLKDAATIPIGAGVTMGDYLHGFMAGLSSALTSRGRQVIQLQIKEVSPANLGALIALYERAVAIYAELIHINAFHQPGVQAYKLASKDVIDLTRDIQRKLAQVAPWRGTAAEFVVAAELQSKGAFVEGVLAKFCVNASQRDFGGFKISRRWNAEKGWIFKVSVDENDTIRLPAP